MSLYVGTSGWAYKAWKPDFYPAALPESKFLEHYARTLGACEINATFYRSQSPKTFARWRDAAPDGFRYAIKVHRAITHAKVLAPDKEKRGFIDAFAESVSILGPRLGAFLLDFPAHRKRDDYALDALLSALPERVARAFELRHPSWNSQEVMQKIAAANGTVCVSERDGAVPNHLPEGPIAYVRLRHGAYSGTARAGWKELLASEAASRDVYIFAKHEGSAASDPYGGVGLASWLHGSAG